VLVIANETAPSAQLRDVVRAATHDRLDASVLVVAPALNTRTGTGRPTTRSRSKELASV
jgi:hypothetical protein